MQNEKIFKEITEPIRLELEWKGNRGYFFQEDFTLHLDSFDIEMEINLIQEREIFSGTWTQPPEVHYQDSELDISGITIMENKEGNEIPLTEKQKDELIDYIKNYITWTA